MSVDIQPVEIVPPSLSALSLRHRFFHTCVVFTGVQTICCQKQGYTEYSAMLLYTLCKTKQIKLSASLYSLIYTLSESYRINQETVTKTLKSNSHMAYQEIKNITPDKPSYWREMMCECVRESECAAGGLVLCDKFWFLMCWWRCVSSQTVVVQRCE